MRSHTTEDAMASASKATAQAFKLKGTAPAVTMLVLQTADLDAFDHQLAEHIAQLPQFFLHAPVMLDVEALKGTPVDFVRIAALLRDNHLVPVAVRNLDEVHREAAIGAGWGVLQSALVRPSRASVAAPPADAPAAPDPVPPHVATTTITVRHPIRSGQVVHAAEGDLVVLAAVSSGAEVVAHGNIHVYAPLRGRAFAGADDDPEASIFCMNLDAEFLSIAGRSMTSEEIPAARRGKPARIQVENDHLVVTPL
jgi:septum site-determining protein MinC